MAGPPSRGAETFADAALHAVLEHAPFEWVVLESAERCILRQRVRPPPEGRYRVLRLPSGRAIRWWLMSGRRWDYLFLLEVTSQYKAEEVHTQLFAGLSHELRTPVGAILTHLEVLRLPDIPEETKAQSLHLLWAET